MKILRIFAAALLLGVLQTCVPMGPPPVVPPAPVAPPGNLLPPLTNVTLVDFSSDKPLVDAIRDLINQEKSWFGKGIDVARAAVPWAGLTAALIGIPVGWYAPDLYLSAGKWTLKTGWMFASTLAYRAACSIVARMEAPLHDSSALLDQTEAFTRLSNKDEIIAAYASLDTGAPGVLPALSKKKGTASVSKVSIVMSASFMLAMSYFIYQLVRRHEINFAKQLQRLQAVIDEYSRIEDARTILAAHDTLARGVPQRTVENFLETLYKELSDNTNTGIVQKLNNLKRSVGRSSNLYGRCQTIHERASEFASRISQRKAKAADLNL